MIRSHVLLDLDGTLSDSSPGITRCVQFAFETCGYRPPTDDEVRPMIGPPFEVTFPAVGVRPTDVERVILAYREEYESAGLFENTMYPGIVAMLDALAGDGHTLSLATAKPQPTAVRILEHFGILDRFHVRAGATVDVGTGRRTKGEVISYALGELGLSTHELQRGDNPVVMVGDRDHDVEGASLNQLPCIGVTWGFGNRQELHHAGAAVIVDTPDEVAAAVQATYRFRRP